MNDDCLLLQALRAPAALPRLTLADWDGLIRQARKAGLLARLRHVLDVAGVLDAIPAQPRAHLDWADVTARGHAHRVQVEVDAIRKALHDKELILLKGAAYTVADLPAARGRVFSDIDILLPREHLVDAENALMAAGWVATHHDAYDQRYYRQWMHELPPLQHIRRETVIDVHHAILPQTMAVHPDPALLRAAAVPVPGHAGLRMLAPFDMLLHSAAHLFYDGEMVHSLRDLSDLDLLLRHFTQEPQQLPDFWVGLMARARELELTRVLFYALRYTHRLLQTPVPDAAFTAAEAGSPGPFLLRIMDHLYLHTLLPDLPDLPGRIDHGAAWARSCLYIRANWLRMPPLMLGRHLFHKAFLSPRN